MTKVARKLIEVALPLEAINKACKTDKDRKTGTIRNLHKWFAPMPPPAWRALLAATLLDDPEDSDERAHLLELVASLVRDDDQRVADEALEEVRNRIGAHYAEDPPVVFDPFCGGGSTLLEAQRLGLPACGSDLNPIPVLMTRMLTQYLPAFAHSQPVSPEAQSSLGVAGPKEGFVRDVRYYAGRVREEALRRLGAYYPSAPDGDPMIAWWWARTIPSPDPQYQGAPTPLVNDWWICKKAGEQAYVSPIVDHRARTIDFEIVAASSGAPPSSKARCLFSDAPIPFPYIKKQGCAGALGTTLLASISQGSHGRQHFPPSPLDAQLASDASPIDPPQLALPPSALGFTVQQYGVESWDQLFTKRQQLALCTFSDVVAESYGWLQEDGADVDYASAVVTFLGLCVGKLAQTNSMQVRLFIDSRNGGAKAQPAFSRPDISPLWDFVETNPFGGSVGDWLQIVETALRATAFAVADAAPARVEQRDARTSADLVPEGSALVATDPPYFSNFGYADPSNYFYIWLRRALKEVHPTLFSTLGAPTSGELIADPTRHSGDKDAAKQYFIAGLREAFQNLKKSSRPDLPMLVVYAFKQQETSSGQVTSTGWEAVLEAIVGAGLSIVGTWPIHGTGSARARGLSSNALATYVLLVCRPRPADAPLTTYGEFRTALRAEISEAVGHLREASIAPVDLAQAVVGPGMRVYSGFSKVVLADGSLLTVRDALGAISESLDEVVEEREADFDPETRWAIAWFDQYGMGDGPYGVADALSRAKNTAVNGLEKAGLVVAKAGKVRLLSPVELPGDWDPATDTRLTVWETTHHLVRSLEEDGESGAGRLLCRLGGFGELARELAYRLHGISDRKNRSQEAFSYNGLAVAWPEIVRLAASDAGSGSEEKLF